MRVLIVDNHLDEVENTLNILKTTYDHCDVVLAKDAMSAKLMVETGVIDLALVEIKLPCDNGYRVVKMIKTFSPHTNVAILTSSKFGVDCYLGIKLGADDIFVKSIIPGNSKDLRGYLKRIEKIEPVNV